jgi:hypothetical protein
VTITLDGNAGARTGALFRLVAAPARASPKPLTVTPPRLDRPRRGVVKITLAGRQRGPLKPSS